MAVRAETTLVAMLPWLDRVTIRHWQMDNLFGVQLNWKSQKEARSVVA
jgi:hypothetical protein